MSPSIHRSPVVLQSGRGRIHSLPPHRNPGLEVVCLLAGRLEWQVEGRVHLLGPGDVFFTLPWQTHGSVHGREPGHEWVYVLLAATGDSPKNLRFPFLPRASADRSGLRARLARPVRQSFPGTALLRELILELRLAARPGEEEFPTRQAALAHALLHEIVRRMDADLPATPELPSPLAALRARLRLEIDRPWSLEEMAKACGWGRTRFEVLFKKEFGEAPIAHLNRLRVERALELLRTTRRSVTEIALACGFSSSQYFARVFKKIVHATPGTWRKVGKDAQGKGRRS